MTKDHSNGPFMGDYGFDIHYHSLHAYGYDDDAQGRLFRNFEKKGYVGLTTSDASPWELREIRRWIRKQTTHIYMSKNIEYYTSDNGGYHDVCNCYWFADPNTLDDFVEFLDTFPERSYFVEVNVHEEPDLLEVFEKTKYESNRRLVLKNRGEAIILFDDAIKAMEFIKKF